MHRLVYAEYKELRVLPKSEDEQFIEESLKKGDLIRIQYDGHVFETLPPDIIALSIEKKKINRKKHLPGFYNPSDAFSTSQKASLTYLPSASPAARSFS